MDGSFSIHDYTAVEYDLSDTCRILITRKDNQMIFEALSPINAKSIASPTRAHL